MCFVAELRGKQNEDEIEPPFAAGCLYGDLWHIGYLCQADPGFLRGIGIVSSDAGGDPDWDIFAGLRAEDPFRKDPKGTPIAADLRHCHGH